MNAIIRSLDELKPGVRICIYGAGEGGAAFKKILSQTREDIEVVCFIDDAKEGSRDGIPIVSLQNIQTFKDRYEYIVVVSAHWRDIVRKLNACDITQYYLIHPMLFFPNQIYTADEIIRYNTSFQQVKGLFYNDRDKGLYDIIVANRSPALFEASDPLAYFSKQITVGTPVQYLDFIVKETITTMIEGGVLDGKNTLEYLSFLPGTGFLHGFEPFYEAYEQGGFKQRIEEHKNVKIYPYALWRVSGKVLFMRNHDNKDGSQIVNIKLDDTHHVQAVSLDDFVKEHSIKKIDYIKLDIEGAELDVLGGAYNLLKSHRPQLAICIYHKKKDIFEIPLFLKGQLKDYTFRLGHYTNSFWDTVLYAIPDEIYRDQ